MRWTGSLNILEACRAEGNCSTQGEQLRLKLQSFVPLPKILICTTRTPERKLSEIQSIYEVNERVRMLLGFPADFRQCGDVP